MTPKSKSEDEASEHEEIEDSLEERSIDELILTQRTDPSEYSKRDKFKEPR